VSGGDLGAWAGNYVMAAFLIGAACGGFLVWVLVWWLPRMLA
jgi:hypothetical protein